MVVIEIIIWENYMNNQFDEEIKDLDKEHIDKKLLEAEHYIENGGKWYSQEEFNKMMAERNAYV